MEKRALPYDPDFTPCPCNQGDEIFSKGHLKLNITSIIKKIESGELVLTIEEINVKSWFLINFQHGTINEAHLSDVDMSKPIIMAEKKHGVFSVIDGNHRMARARRENLQFIPAFKIPGRELLPFFTEKEAYEKFLWEWNEDLSSFIRFR